MEEERQLDQAAWGERMAAWGELAQNNLPPPGAPRAEQRDALLEWSERLRLPLALDNEQGQRIAASASFERIEQEGPRRRLRVPLADGRTIWVLRANRSGQPRDERRQAERMNEARGERREIAPPPPFLRGGGLVAALLVLFFAVSAGAYPVVRRLTRQLEALKRGVETFGGGELSHRVSVSGRDEVAAVATSFNHAADRIEALVRAHQSLLANASHELRSPLARLKMAVSLMETASPESRASLKQEIENDIRELDALVEEVLLASRLDAAPQLDRHDPVHLLALAAEEGVYVDARVEGVDVMVRGDERLLRRALRNLLENAKRYGGTEPPEVTVTQEGAEAIVRVCDRGPGVPEDQRERIFEAFYRMPGHAEHAGGVGLGLSLVRQIAQRHQGQVRCEPREGGGSCFSLRLPLAAA